MVVRVVRLSYCRALTCCSFVALDEFIFGIYYGADLGSPDGSTERTIGVNLKGLFLVD